MDEKICQWNKRQSTFPQNFPRQILGGQKTVKFKGQVLFKKIRAASLCKAKL